MPKITIYEQNVFNEVEQGYKKFCDKYGGGLTPDEMAKMIPPKMRIDSNYIILKKDLYIRWKQSNPNYYTEKEDKIYDYIGREIHLID